MIYGTLSWDGVFCPIVNIMLRGGEMHLAAEVTATHKTPSVVPWVIYGTDGDPVAAGTSHTTSKKIHEGDTLVLPLNLSAELAYASGELP